MSQVLVTAGVASIIIAIVGGGANVFGAHVPIIDSGRRQVALALAGVAFLAGAIALRDDSDDSSSGSANPTVQGYRQEVSATCRVLSQEQNPPINSDGSIEGDAYVSFVRGGFSRAERILARLWQRPVPDTLHDEAMEARRAAETLVSEGRTELDRLASQVPPVSSPPYAEIGEFNRQLTDALSDEQQAYESSMSRLADAPCNPSTPGTGG